MLKWRITSVSKTGEFRGENLGMKRMHMIFDDYTYDIVVKYMKAKNVKTMTTAVKHLIHNGSLYNTEKGRLAVARALNEIDRRQDITNEKLEFLTDLILDRKK